MSRNLKPRVSDGGSRKNAFAPGVWLATPLIAAAVPMAVLAPAWAAIALFVLIGIVVLTLMAIFVRHSLVDPSQLRSEEFGLRMNALQMYGQSPVSADGLARIIDNRSTDLIEYRKIGGSDE